MISGNVGPSSGIAAELSEADLAKIVARTNGYSGSDMRNLIQEACQGPVRNAMGQAAQLSALAHLSEEDFQAIVLHHSCYDVCTKDAKKGSQCACPNVFLMQHWYYC